MKTVMIYGDSLTWGYIPGTGERLPFEKRWPGVVQAKLGNDIRIVEEALNGRTTLWEDSFLPDRDGRKFLPMLLEAHSPIDLFVLLLGGNDLQSYRGLTAAEAARGCRTLVQIAKKSGCGPKGGAPKILLIAPPPLGKAVGFQRLLFIDREAESRKLPGMYEEVAKFMGCAFFDASRVASPSPIDGVHIDEEGQQKLGLALADVIKGIINGA